MGELAPREAQMRIIGGVCKGKRLFSPPQEVRPTTDRLREALFNVLGAEVSGSVWLDVFAGSGAVGIEALSRGASLVHFNERDTQTARVLRRNLSSCQIEEGFLIHQKDAFVFFNQLNPQSVTHIYLDPPYSFGRYEKLLKKISDWITPGSNVVVLLEVFKKTPVDFLPPGWRLERRLRAGDSCILVLRPS